MTQTRTVAAAWSVFIVAASLLAPGCQPAELSVPDALTAAERLPVRGRQGAKLREELRFGTYEARAVHRSWTRGSDGALLVYERNARTQEYTFVLVDASVEHWRVDCAAALRRRTVHTPLADVEVENASRLTCRLRAANGTADPWHLILEELSEQPLAGRLTDGRATLDVEGTRRLRKGLPAESTAGYHLADTSGPVAAVEVIGGGAVWLGTQVQPDRRPLLAAAAAALLLYEELRVHLPDELAER